MSSLPQGGGAWKNYRLRAVIAGLFVAMVPPAEGGGGGGIGAPGVSQSWLWIRSYPLRRVV